MNWASMWCPRGATFYNTPSPGFEMERAGVIRPPSPAHGPTARAVRHDLEKSALVSLGGPPGLHHTAKRLSVRAYQPLPPDVNSFGGGRSTISATSARKAWASPMPGVPASTLEAEALMGLRPGRTSGGPSDCPGPGMYELLLWHASLPAGVQAEVSGLSTGASMRRDSSHPSDTRLLSAKIMHGHHGSAGERRGRHRLPSLPTT